MFDPVMPPTTPAATTPTKPPVKQYQEGATHPEIILYALMFYSFYFAAKQTAKDISDPSSPTANGLFEEHPLNYKLPMVKKNIKDTPEDPGVATDIKLLQANASDEAMIRSGYGELIWDEGDEKGVESEDGSSDMDGEASDEE